MGVEQTVLLSRAAIRTYRQPAYCERRVDRFARTRDDSFVVAQQEVNLTSQPFYQTQNPLIQRR